jgi:hypothetical protein
MCPIVYFDALRLKIHDEGMAKNKAVYLALGIRVDGRKEMLSLWIAEGAQFWLKVFDKLKNCGLQDILIAVVDGLQRAITVNDLNVAIARTAEKWAGWCQQALRRDRKQLNPALSMSAPPRPLYLAGATTSEPGFDTMRSRAGRGWLRAYAASVSG